MTEEMILAKAKELCEECGGKLLYLSRFGSHLYGTNTPKSDEDFKGVYLPRISDLIMGKRGEPVGYQSKDDPTQKNSAGDIDLQVFPIQFWLNKLVRKGETEGIELLYSHTNRDAILFIDPVMEEVFMNKTVLFDPRNTQGFLGFAIGQARTYFTKAERFNVIKDVYEYVIEYMEANPDSPETNEYKKLSVVLDTILSRFSHQSYCFETVSNELRSLQICGKVHHETIELREFITRIGREYKKYGHRTKAAADLDNKDWKSLSHALKAIIEVRTLLTDMNLEFPLPIGTRGLLKAIKLGSIEFEKVERMILAGIDEVDSIKTQFDCPSWHYDAERVREIIAGMYGISV